ncbi:ICE-like protease (caspase) p20 domain protein [Ceratobasidium sp. AG-Ba]|nr:ICE-like protease (caspase) p20 domain protein [Ceratobasidium sp. AG-Ba]
MGKPSNSKTTQRTSVAEVVDPRVGQDELRATTSIKPLAKAEPTSTLTASLTSRPPSPSFESPRHELPAPTGSPYDALHYQLPTLSTPKSQHASGLRRALVQTSIDVLADDDGDVFHDALEEFEEQTPITPVTPSIAKHQRAVGIQQAPYDPKLEGRCKGRTNVTARSSRAPRTTATYAPFAQAVIPGRGSSSSVAAPSIFSSPSWSAAPPLPQPTPQSTGPTKKALLIGVNYRTGDKSFKLKYAARDALRMGNTLADVLQFPEENLVFVTDDKRTSGSSPPGAFGHVVGQVAAAPAWNPTPLADSMWKGAVHREGKRRFVEPTRANMLEGFKWLTAGTKEGDVLVMLFSGHCVYVNGRPLLITADAGGSQGISQDDLRRELVQKVPKGCRLTIVLDCCHSASMVNLQYCIGNMRPKEQTCESEPVVTVVTAEAETTACPTTKPGSEPERSNLQTSLYGVRPGIVMQEPNPVLVEEPEEPEEPIIPQTPVAPGGFNVASFAPPPQVQRANKRQGGVVAASAPAPAPVPAPASTTSSWIPAWITGGATAAAAEEPPPALEARPSAATSAGVRRTRNCVVEATRPSDYFEERKVGFDRLEGDVTVWAAAGADQSAYEAYGNVKHGIVTNAFCKALETCQDITIRNIWGSLQLEVDRENRMRYERDQAKSELERPDPKGRVQHAELWVSQIQDSDCVSLALDRRAFCSGVVAGSQPRVAAAPG